MDLEKLNSKVYEMWKVRREAGPDYFQPSSDEEILEIEKISGASFPEDYKDFLRNYSTIGAVPRIGANYFPCDFPEKKAICYTFTIVPWAALTIQDAESLYNADRFRDNVGPRVPKELLPLTSDSYATILIDLRPETYGNIHFINEIEHQTFGTPGYGWNNIGYVAPNFTAFIKELGTEEELKARYPGRDII